MKRELDQWMTPDWVAQELVERYFGDLTLFDRVIEPSCGDGAFLRALPSHVPVAGIEIDPKLGTIAARTSGRPVLIGDFLTVDLPHEPTVILGNPPFRNAVVRAFLDRAWSLLPTGGRCAFVLPAYTFQTASAVVALQSRWSIQQDMLPRNLFERLRLPLCFAQFTKDRHGRLFGFALYGEAHAVNRLARRYRALLAAGERSAWGAVTRAALEALGGEADLADIYREVEGCRPTSNKFWHAKVRQVVQRIAVRVRPGRWALPARVAA
jgi:site-specific DNA-methyltransferase (adenine-specific)